MFYKSIGQLPISLITMGKDANSFINTKKKNIQFKALFQLSCLKKKFSLWEFGYREKRGK